MADSMANRAFLGFLVALLLGTSSTAPYRAVPVTSSGTQMQTASTVSPKLRKPLLPLHRHVSAGLKRTPTRPLPSAATGRLSTTSAALNQPGLNALDNGAFQSSPPDATGSIGPNHYVEMVNEAIGVYTRSDLSLVVSKSLRSWLVQPSTPVCDPQVQWDSSSQRWLYVVLACAFNAHKFFYGWSKTSDPSDLVSGWCRFSRSTPNVLADYPKLGHNSKYMMVGTNNFSDSGINAFVTAQISWMRTPAPGNSSCVAPAVGSFGSAAAPMKNGDGMTLTGTPVPVNTTRNANDGYVVSAYDPYGPPAVAQTKLAVWHLDSSGVLHAHADIPVTTYAIPAAAPNLGGAPIGIDTLDGRLTQAVGDPTTGIYTQHTVNGPGGRSVVRWYEIQVASSVATLTQQGDIAGSDWVFNGAISPRSDGQGAVIFYNRSSATTYPVIATQGRMVSTPTGQMDPGEIVLVTSTAGDQDFSCNNPSPGFPCRWGDYAGASPDPVNGNVVWGSNQALSTPSVPDGPPNWVTQNFAIVGPLSRVVQQSSTPSPIPTRSPAAPSSPSPSPGAR